MDNKKTYIKPSVSVISYNNVELLSSSNPEHPGDAMDGRAKGTGSFNDFSDDDEDDLFYKKYTVKW